MIENQRRINEFNRNNRPFYIVDQDDGTFSLCLPFDLLEGKYANYCQKAFDNYAKSIGDPLYTPIGLRTHGNGYEWEAAFREVFKNDPDIGRVIFDCEAGGFYCNCDSLDIIEDFGERFKEVCENTDLFTRKITEGIPNAEAREKAQEQLMKTVRGHLMKYPNATFDILTPDGGIHLNPEDTKMLLSGEANEVMIADCHYAAFELLDQEVTNMQVDLFHSDIIRMKTSGDFVEGFELTM